MVVKIGIFGSCSTRDIFRTVYNYKYSEDFKVCFDFERISFISLIQDAMSIDENLLKIYPENNSNKMRTKRLKDDFYGINTLNNLESVDYIIIDLYFEVKFGIIIDENGNVFTNNYWDFPDTEYQHNLSNSRKININDNFQEYMDRFKESFDFFYKYLKKKFPDVKFILNSVRYLNKMKDENDQIIEKLSQEYVNQNNYSLSKLENFIKDNYDCYHIDFEERFLDEKHIWGVNEVHYTPEYYQYTYRQLLKIVMKTNNHHNYETQLTQKPLLKNVYYDEEKQLLFKIPDGYSVENASEKIVLLTNGYTRIKFNEENYSEDIKISVEVYSKNNPETDVKYFSEELVKGIVVQGLKFTKKDDIQYHIWFNKNHHTYHIYMNGNDKSAIKQIICSILNNI